MFTLQPLGWLIPTSNPTLRTLLWAIKQKITTEFWTRPEGLNKTLSQCKTKLTWRLTLKEWGAMLKEKWLNNSDVLEEPQRSTQKDHYCGWWQTVTHKAFVWRRIKLATLKFCWAYLERNLHTENVKCRHWTSHTHESTKGPSEQRCTNESSGK